jgi:NADH-quinone oxidoreductase subunit L
LIAVQQNDIKRILAYSTLSQLGYMVMAVGLSGVGGNPAPAMYHLTTHAAFKALLFLGAGSVIHALHHEQDIWRMGALSRRMPVTYWTFLAGTLALCGVPPLSGFFSKDAILALAWETHHHALFALAVGVAALTAFYMFRLVFVAFTGPAKSQAPDHAHESPAVMTAPLVALAVPSLLAGFWGIDRWFGRQYGVESAHAVSGLGQWSGPFEHAPMAAFGGLAAAGVGVVTAWVLYRKAVSDPLPARLGLAMRGLRDRLYFDELYQRLIGATQEALARLVDGFDRWIVAVAVVKGTHGTIELAGRLLRLVQTGNLQTYAFLFAAGVVALLLYLVAR